MKIKSLIVLILVFATLVVAGERPSALVKKAKGDARLFKKGEDNYVKLKKGMLLNSGDKIVTREKAFVAIKFLDDASLLRIRANSECVIRGEWNDEGEQDKSIWVSLGEIWAGITRQKSVFEVRTPTAVASVKGTKFWTIQREDGESIFIGEEGLIEIANALGTVLLRKGQTALVKGKQSAPKVRRTKAGETPGGDSEVKRYELEFEFNNDVHERKTLIIDVEK
jgi:hypothetical protein